MSQRWGLRRAAAGGRQPGALGMVPAQEGSCGGENRRSLRTAQEPGCSPELTWPERAALPGPARGGRTDPIWANTLLPLHAGTAMAIRTVAENRACTAGCRPSPSVRAGSSIRRCTPGVPDALAGSPAGGGAGPQQPRHETPSTGAPAVQRAAHSASQAEVHSPSCGVSVPKADKEGEESVCPGQAAPGSARVGPSAQGTASSPKRD